MKYNLHYGKVRGDVLWPYKITQYDLITGLSLE